MKRLVVTILERLNKKCIKFVCGLVQSVRNNTSLFWDFRYLKVNCNLSVKSKLSCRCLSAKLSKNTRHPMIETCKRFFLMRLLQWSVKSSRPGVLQKRYSEIFGKIHKRTPVLESFFCDITEAPTQLFSCEFYKILRALILQSISERLLLKRYMISLSGKIVQSSLIFCYYGNELPHISPFFLNPTNYRRVPCLIEDLNFLQEIFRNSVHWNHANIFSQVLFLFALF